LTLRPARRRASRARWLPACSGSAVASIFLFGQATAQPQLLLPGDGPQWDRACRYRDAVGLASDPDAACRCAGRPGHLTTCSPPIPRPHVGNACRPTPTRQNGRHCEISRAALAELENEYAQTNWNVDESVDQPAQVHGDMSTAFASSSLPVDVSKQMRADQR
jgi:hypothetical protein